ncbi:MAG: cytochrome c3 family protein [Acidobacteriota bacterium]
MALVLFAPGSETFHALGPMNTGHAEVQCSACHRQAPGTFRQQVQANARYAFGLRPEPADFGLADVSDAACLDCHERPNDRHPTFRFLEPRFAKARENLQPQTCMGCHLEHAGERITVKADYCSECHGDLELKVDPVDTPHHELVATASWNTCLGCHDFHGNHLWKAPTRMADRLDPAVIEEYFRGGPSPYSDEKEFRATRTTLAQIQGRAQ